MSLFNADEYSIKIAGTVPIGVQSFSMEENISKEKISCLGAGFLTTESQSPEIASISVDRVIGSPGGPTSISYSPKEILIYYGKNSPGGSAHAIKAKSCYLDSYNFKCSANEIGMESLKFSVYGGVEKDSTASEVPKPSDADGYYGLRSSSLTINFPFKESVVAESLDYSVSINYLQKPILGSSKISLLELDYPIIIEARIDALVSEYDLEHIINKCDEEQTDIVATARDCDGATIATFNVPDARIINFSLNGAIDNMLSASFTFRSFSNETGVLIT